MVPVLRNNSGFTLIELMVASFIMMIGLLALLQTVNYSISVNQGTVMRNEAMLLADEKMSIEKSRTFDNVSGSGSYYEMRKINNAMKNYSVVKTVAAMGTTSKSVEFDVIWKNRGTRYVHSISTVLSKTK